MWLRKFPRRGSLLLMTFSELNWMSSQSGLLKTASLELRSKLYQPGQESLPGLQDAECSWWERPVHLGINQCSWEVWLSWGLCRAFCRKGGHKRSVCHCIVSALQTPRRARCVESLLWGAAVHHGEWGQGLHSHGNSKDRAWSHEVYGWCNDPQWGPC